MSPIGAESGRARSGPGLARLRPHDVGRRVEHALPRDHLASMREVDLGHRQVLGRDVLPHVELGEIRDRKHAQVLSRCDREVVEAPQLGPLVLRLPLPERIAHADHALLRPRAIFVAARPSERDVEAVLGDGVEQRHRLQAIARRGRPDHIGDAPAIDRVLYLGDDQPLAELGDARVAKCDHLREVVPGVDVDERERNARRPEGLLREARQEQDRVLCRPKDSSSGHGSFALGDAHASRHDLDRFDSRAPSPSVRRVAPRKSPSDPLS